MRYLTNGTFQLKLRDIVGEVINITLDREFFIRGVLNDTKPNKAYNVYKIATTTYQPVMLYGVLVINNKAYIGNYIDDLTQAYHLMMEELRKKYPCDTKQHTHVFSDMYLLKTEDKPTYTNVLFNKAKKSSKYKNISTEVQVPNYMIWHVIFNEVNQEINAIADAICNQDPLSSIFSIIYDEKKIVDLPDEYKSIDWPQISDLKSYKNSTLLIDTLQYSATSGVMPSLISNHDIRDMKIGYGSTRAVDMPIPWVKLDWINPVLRNSKFAHFNDQIRNGNFPLTFSDGVIRNNIDVLKTYKCFATNTPIYDEFYIFDIMEIIEEGKITYTKLKTPVSLLISPYYSKFALNNNFNIFETSFKLRMQVYKTVSAYTLYNVICDSTYNDLSKKVLIALAKWAGTTDKYIHTNDNYTHNIEDEENKLTPNIYLYTHINLDVLLTMSFDNPNKIYGRCKLTE